VEFHPTLDEATVRLIAHDLERCVAFCAGILSERDSGLPASARNELVVCAAACTMASDSLRDTGRNRLAALEFCEQACRRFAEACAPLGERAGIHISVRMAALCSDTLQQVLYDA
jgi:hypothetical protein